MGERNDPGAPGRDRPAQGTLRERLQASAEFCFYAAENLYDSLDETDSKTWTKAQNEAENIINDISVLGTMVMGAVVRIQAPAGLYRPRLVA